MSEKKSGDNSSLIIWAMVVGGIIGYQYWQKIKWILLDYYFEHRFQIILLVTGLAMILLSFVFQKIKSKVIAWRQEKNIVGEGDEDSVFAGFDDGGQEIYIKTAYRTMHTQVIGTTNAGKTESVIVPWAIDDIQKGRGFVLVDGKADLTLLNKLYAYAKRYNRQDDFKVLSLSETDISSSFNPLLDGTPLEITERIFEAFIFEDPYYKNIQFDYLKNVLSIFDEANEVTTFLKLSQAIKDIGYLSGLAKKTKNNEMLLWVKEQEGIDAGKREQRLSGLLTQINHFTSQQFINLFNQENPIISIRKAMEKGQIVYFQLPVLRAKFLGKATAKLVLQELQFMVSERLRLGGDNKFFSFYLDDFSEYLTEGFASMLNKSRSANVGVTFAHQSLGDLNPLGDDIKNIILTNSNLKVFMRTNEPDSAEYFSRVVGTTETNKKTERVKTHFLFGDQGTGDGSSRRAEAFVIHPGVFKNELGTGEAVVVIPHFNGAKTVRLKFQKLPDLPTRFIPLVNNPEPHGLSLVLKDEKLKSDAKDAPDAQVLSAISNQNDEGRAA